MNRIAPFLFFLGLAAAPAAPAASPILSSEFVNPGAPYPSCHASTIAETSGGALVAAWFGGTVERNPDVGIWVARREQGAWALAREVADGVRPGRPRLPTWNPVLFQEPGGPLLLFYKVGPSPEAWWGEALASADDGRTWGKPRRLPDGILGPIKDKPIGLPGGVILAGASTEGGPLGWRVHFESSADGGRTWSVSPPVASNGFAAIQPTILFHPGSRLQALCRTKEGVIVETWSHDGGRNWSPLAPTELPNPNSGIDAVTLADGRQLLVYNHSRTGAGGKSGPRYPLNVALSADGRTWRQILVLEDRPDPAGYAYPAVIQASDGLVHITYTWHRRMIRHVVLDPRRF